MLTVSLETSLRRQQMEFKAFLPTAVLPWTVLCPPLPAAFSFPTAAEAHRGQLCPWHAVLLQSSWPSSRLSAGRREPGPTLSPEVPTLCLPSPSPTQDPPLCSTAALPGHRAFSYPHRGPQNVRVVGTGQNAPALPVFTPSPHPPALSLVTELPDLCCFPLPCTFHECP